MNFDYYSIISDDSDLTYKFQSTGPKGIIKKVVTFRKIISSNENYYNLSFGDWEIFKPGINFDAFLIKSKEIKL